MMNIIVENNPATFLSPFSFKITFECLQPIKEEIEWKLIYVGSAKDEKYDQILESFSMENLQAGIMQFTLESNPPNPQLIPTKDDLFGVTAIIITIAYRKQEFFRCGYYVYNNYVEEELLMNDPTEILLDRIQRNILSDKPRITRYNIDWGLDDEVKKMLYLGQDLSKANVLSDATNIMNGEANYNYGSEMRKFMEDAKIGFIDNNSYNPFSSSNGIFNTLNNIPTLQESFTNGWSSGNMNGGGFF